jgi:hypothetical protein
MCPREYIIFKLDTIFFSIFIYLTACRKWFGRSSARDTLLASNFPCVIESIAQSTKKKKKPAQNRTGGRNNAYC